MSYRIIRTDRFDTSLREFITYIADFSEGNAVAFADGVITAVENITAFPEKAVRIAPNVRVALYKGYWIPYKIDGEVIFVLDVLNPRQDSKARLYRDDV